MDEDKDENKDDQLLPDVSDTNIDDSDDDDPQPASDAAKEEDLTAGLTLEECLAKAGDHKSEGNEAYKASRSREAIASYKLGVRYLTKHKLEEDARPILIALHTNSAACHSRLGTEAEA